MPVVRSKRNSPLQREKQAQLSLGWSGSSCLALTPWKARQYFFYGDHVDLASSSSFLSSAAGRLSAAAFCKQNVLAPWLWPRGAWQLPKSHQCHDCCRRMVGGAEGDAFWGSGFCPAGSSQEMGWVARSSTAAGGGLLMLKQVVKLEQEAGALQADLLLWVEQKSQGQRYLCVGRFDLYNLPLLGLWMGFSVAQKEAWCLNPAVILPFKINVAISLCPQHSGNPPRQVMLAVMWRKGRFWQRDLQVHILAHRLECHLLKQWLVRNSTKAQMKLRTWRFYILPLLHVSYQCVLGKLVSQPMLWT